MIAPGPDWAELCAEAAVGGLSALAGVPQGRLERDPILRRLLKTVAAQAAAAARAAGHAVSGDPPRAALSRCRARPRHIHPWLARLRRGRPTGADAVLAPLLSAARGGPAAETLRIVGATLRRLEKQP